ncbi:TPA: hypothetical protein KNG82_002200 [Escherichia coli]|nr:hypothetical protein [Escherichia coli]
MKRNQRRQAKTLAMVSIPKRFKVVDRNIKRWQWLNVTPPARKTLVAVISVQRMN